MSGKKTSLITGSNAKIKINDITLAYAVDLQYDLSVATIPVETMGRYEVLANEPISLTVSGSFSVVRYTKAASTGLIDGAAADGNGVGNWGTKTTTSSTAAATGKPDKGLAAHVNPREILTSKTVDIVVYRKGSNNGDLETVTTIYNVRITRMSGSVNKRGILMESFQFVGEMMDNDSFSAAHSGEADLSD